MAAGAMIVAVLGLGSAGRRHARLLRGLGHDVVAFDPEPSAVAGVGLARSEEEAVEAAEAVVVASPSACHASQALMALGRGRPVLVEKPVAATVADGERVARAALEAGRVCAVAMNLRFHPALLRLRTLIAGPDLGPLRYARASYGHDLRRWRPGTDYRRSYSARADLGGGIVLDAVHELDYLLWLVGPVHSVSAEAGHVSPLEVDVEDLAVASLRFESGVLGSLDLNFFEPAYRRSCLLVGDDAVVSWDWVRETIELRGPGGERIQEVGCDLEDTYREELADFLEAVATGTDPRTTADEGVAALRLAEAIKRSAGTGMRVEL